MAVTGRKPKPEGQKVHRNPPTHEWTEVIDEPFAGEVPELPDSIGWPAGTRRWWGVICRMPHCILWSEADWQFALDTALIAKAFHEGDMRTATELRQREKVLGTTGDARRDLRIRYVKRPEAAPAGVTSLADYRDL